MLSNERKEVNSIVSSIQPSLAKVSKAPRTQSVGGWNETTELTPPNKE